MPRDAPVAKVEGVRALGAGVGRRRRDKTSSHRGRPRAAEQAGQAFVHPFDDLDVIAGQGTLGLELLEEVPELARVMVPVGGGGLAVGLASAMKAVAAGGRDRRRPRRTAR